MTADDLPPWPNLFVAGVAKAGTTSLYRYLGEHPEIFMSPVKETGFFNHTLDEVEGDPDALAEAEAGYRALFADADGAPVRGEASPGYFWHPDVPERIADRVDDARLLFSLRDPVERAYSDYLMSVREGRFDRPFLDHVEADIEAIESGGQPSSVVPQGRYHTHLSRFIDVLGRDRIHVVLLDDLEDDPLGLLEGVADFLGVDPGPMAEVDYGTRHNPYGEPVNAVAAWLRNSDAVARVARLLLPKDLRIYLGDDVLLEKPEKPPMDPKARRVLEEYYAPELSRLEDLLGRELPELRSSWSDTTD